MHIELSPCFSPLGDIKKGYWQTIIEALQGAKMTLGLRLLATRLSASMFTWKVSMRSGGVCTLIALHHGHNTKRELFASCHGWVDIFGSSEVLWIKVECNKDSLSPSKVKKAFTGLHDSYHSSKMNSPLGGNWILTAVLPKNLHKWQQLPSQPMAVWQIQKIHS